MKEEVILNNIAQVVVRSDNMSRSSIGLFAGMMGELLFLFHYSQIEKKYEDIAYGLLESLIEEVQNSPNLSYTYCNGLAGMGIGLQILEKEGFLESVSDALEDFDSLLEQKLKQDISCNNYDFLHGAIGLGFYFLKRYECGSERSLVQINSLISYLESTALADNAKNEIKWVSMNNGRAEYNISLSHGISSIIVFLSRLLALNIQADRVSRLLYLSTNYVLSQRIDFERYGSYFPYLSIESTNVLGRSRLAWCYGDLGVAVALWHAGNALQRQNWVDLSVEILRFSARRRDLESNLVKDACICHGTAGIAQIFYRMFKNTHIPELKEASGFWINKTLIMSCHQDGSAGYKTYDSVNNTWFNTTSLLEGIAGIGLVLLSFLSGEEYSWDECLLLS